MEKVDSTIDASGTENLDELLDCCLEDFGKPLPKTVSSDSEQNASPVLKEIGKPASQRDNASWSEEFQQFSEVMEQFLEEEPGLNELRNMMGNINQEGNPDFARRLEDTLRNLTEGAQNIPEPTPEDLANLFEGLGLPEPGEGGGPQLLPLMQDMMQNLMSKELLYPSLKDIVDKYPKWLEDQRPTLDESEHARFREQFVLMKEVCRVFEVEEGCSEQAKRKNFETILQLMQKIQACGNPPKELVSDTTHSLPLDEDGNVQIPGMPQQCAIM